MTSTGANGRLRLGLLWRGNRAETARSPRAEAMLGPLFDAFANLEVEARAVVYSDDAVDDVRDELLSLDGVIVWVNPIQDGADRAKLDTVLRDASRAGVWVSAHPDTILSMGTKEVLYRTRRLGWGTDTNLYESEEEFAKRFPGQLAHDRVRVVKQARGNGGNGVWKVEVVDQPFPGTDTGSGARVRVQSALSRDGVSEETTLGRFITTSQECFAWSGSLVDQPFIDRLADGMVRCYFVEDEVVGFCHQWPKGLLPPATPADDGTEDRPEQRPVMVPPDTAEYQRLRAMCEDDWIPGMKDILGLATESMPVIWDADFLYGPKTSSGEDTYILCEINVSAVWPYPPYANRLLTQAAVARMRSR